MIWNICFLASLGVIAFAIAYSSVLAFGKYKKGRQLTAIHILLAGCYLVGVLSSIPPYAVLYGSTDVGLLKTFVLACLNSLRAFGIEEYYSVFFETIHHAPAWVSDWYMTVALVVQFLAPLLTFGFLLTLFKNAAAYGRYCLSYFRVVYAFSELNDRSIALARDLLKNHKRAKIVFTDVYETGGEEISELIESAKEIGAICFKKDIAAINFGFHSSRKEIYFFAIGSDEGETVGHALKLIGDYNHRPQTHLYIFSTGAEGELLLAGKEKGVMRVRRVDEARSLVTRLLYDSGDRIFTSAVPIEGSDEKQISAVIVGLGALGTEMLRAMSWYCQMDGYRVKINAFDQDVLAEEKFTALCPELMSPTYNGVTVPGEAAYTITIHSGVNIGSKRFADEILRIKDATYVFVCLGNDELNVRAAANLRMLCERAGAKPIIQAVIRQTDANRMLRSVRNNAGQPYGIEGIGDIVTSYSERVIIDSDAEEDAFTRHKAYCNGDPEQEENFWRYEYCYRSSMASAIHGVARIKCGFPGAEKCEDDLTPAERDALEVLEHKRWNAYMRSEGYVYSGSPLKASRNDLAKMHHNLVVYEALNEEDKRKDSRVGSAK